MKRPRRFRHQDRILALSLFWKISYLSADASPTSSRCHRHFGSESSFLMLKAATFHVSAKSCLSLVRNGTILTPTPHYWGGFSGQKKAKNQKTCAKFWKWCHRKVQRKLIWTYRKILSKSIFSYIYGRRKNISYVLKFLAIQIQIYKLYILK